MLVAYPRRVKAAGNDVLEDLPSVKWFDRWWFLLTAAMGLGLVLALALQFQVGGPALTGPMELGLFVSIGFALVALPGFLYTLARFWIQMRRGEHITRAERIRHIQAYILAFAAGASAFVGSTVRNPFVAGFAFFVAFGLIAFGFALRPRKRARRRRSERKPKIGSLPERE